MILQFCLKVALFHYLAIKLVYASASSWASQQIETEKAWELARGRGSNVLIAVVDTGIGKKHPATLWTNPGETGLDSRGRDKSGNRVDDDRNGFIDDVHGWNFVTDSHDIFDHHGHGSHIAGIISEIAPQSELMILKYYDPKGSAEKNVENTLKAFQYAIQMKVQIINFSGGGAGENPAEEKVLKVAEKEKILLVAAAGNDGINTDIHKYYPANYPLRNILSVTALDQKGKLPYFGNFGKNTVHLAAPGEQIVSQLSFGAKGEMSGTSQATAFVTGAAALLLSQSSSALDPQLVIQKLTGSGNPLRSLNGKTISGASLNAYRALTMKTAHESAAGFVFENESEWNSDLYTVSSSALDVKPSLRQSRF